MRLLFIARVGAEFERTQQFRLAAPTARRIVGQGETLARACASETRGAGTSHDAMHAGMERIGPSRVPVDGTRELLARRLELRIAE